jgi:hypothetical protein
MKILTAILFVSLLQASGSVPSDDGKTYHSKYEVGAIPGMDKFMKLDKQEEYMISMKDEMKKYRDSLLQNASAEEKSSLDDLEEDDYRDNRARIYDLSPDSLASSGKADSLAAPYGTLPCLCMLNKDTLQIQAGAGFFAGGGLTIRISGDTFQSGTYAWMESAGGNIYRSSLSDTFKRTLDAHARFQYLRLSEQPTFKPGQLLNGYLTMTTQDYWVKEYGDEVKKYTDKNKVLFRCKTKTMPEIFKDR